MNTKLPIQDFPLIETAIALSLILGYLWLFHDYLALFISALTASLSFIILVISAIAEFLEKSNLPYWYFRLLWMLILIPMVLFLIFGGINSLNFEWLRVN